MKNSGARRASIALASTIAAIAALTGGAASAAPAAPAAPAINGSAASAAPVAGGSAAPALPTIPYEPPALDNGGVRSPFIPAAVWDKAENGIGRIAGVDLGMDALDAAACTPVTAIHIPGSGETNEQRDPDVPHGRIVSGLGHDLEGEFGGDVRNLYLPYVSDAFLTSAYESSSARGLDSLGALVAAVETACPGTDYVFTGYSQGADILNAWVAGGASSIDPDRILAMTLFGNPRRGADVAVVHGTAPADSMGILGPHEGAWGPLTDRVFDSCNLGDLWCDATPAMRRIAPAVMSASFNPADAAGTRKAIETAVGSGALADPEIREAVEQLLMFLLDQSSDHLQYETEVGGAPSARTVAREFLVERIADDLS